MARYALEHEFVFHPTTIGFPSLKGCHGLVYVTDAGLFGYHNYGNEYADRYDVRFALFKTWVTGHPQGRSPGRAVYGACYLTCPTGDPNTIRAYSDPKRTNWIAELAAFAAAANNFTGPIYGYDLGKSQHQGSTIVEFTKVGGTCVVQARQWVDHQAATVKQGNVNHTDIQYVKSKGYDVSLVDQTGDVVTAVSQAGYVTVYPEKLR